MKHKQKLNDIHPASPGCRPGTYPLIEEEVGAELQIKQASLSRQDHRNLYLQLLL